MNRLTPLNSLVDTNIPKGYARVHVSVGPHCCWACTATPVSKPALPNHCQIAFKFGKTGIFETGPAIMAGAGFETEVAVRALIKQ
jgi:hypothetical protein